jgi:hypothetical protein
VFSIQILVMGLTALVPISEGQAVVLMPSVKQDELKDCGMHMLLHEAHLGFSCAQWDYGGLVVKKADGDKICWIALDKKSVELLGIDSWAKQPDPEISLLLRRNLPPEVGPPPVGGLSKRTVRHLTAIDWLPKMADIEPEYSRAASSVMEGDGGERLQARAQFPFSSQKSCRFTGEGGQQKDFFGVPMYVFKRKRVGASFMRRAQALAGSAVFEVNQIQASGEIEIAIAPLAEPDQANLLTLKKDARKEEVHLALAQLIPNGDTMKQVAVDFLSGGREERDSHFRVYYTLAENPPACDRDAGFPPGAMSLPFQTHWTRRISRASLRSACNSPFFLKEDEFRERYTLDNIENWIDSSYTAGFGEFLRKEGDGYKVGPSISPIKVPCGYELMNVVGPPLCTPLRMEPPRE